MRTIALILCAALGGCAFGRDEIGGKELDQNTSEIDARVQETRTLSNLAKLESSVSDYYKAEGRVPAKLDALVPKYLAVIPSVELGIPGHKETAAVQYYDNDVLRDGHVDGSQLRDSGRWGYTFNDRQVVIFIDCTHSTSRGSPWFKERGVF